MLSPYGTLATPARMSGGPACDKEHTRNQLLGRTCASGKALQRTPGLYDWSISNNLLATAFVGNTRETIAWVHGSFAVLFSPLFSGHASNPKREPQRG